MTRSPMLAVLATVGISLWAQAGLAHSPSELETLRKDVEALKQGQTAIQKDLQEIKGLLRARPAATATPAAAPREAVVTTDGAPFRGKPDAR
ncbi:MAG: hypothetical protein ACRDGM_21015, partial [bacterium]